MRRRDFITVFGSTAAAWPFAARAQQNRLPLIGYIHTSSPEPYALMTSAFRDGLREMGYVDGQNVNIEFRWAEGHADRLPAFAAELVARNVAVLATGGGDVAASAAKQTTTTIPIVFVTGSDPVETHLVASLSRPGVNLTGITFFTIELGPKRLGLLRELVPNARIVAVLVDPGNVNSGITEGLANVQRAASDVGQRIEVVKAANGQEIDEAFNAIGQMDADALLVVSSPLFTNSRYQIVALANHNRIAAIYPFREYVQAGGLLSYGSSIIDAYRESGVYTGRVLRGEKPADLPVLQPTKFDLAINLGTAKKLGVSIPSTLLATADEVIE
jgi:putative ABC transport system substrate-binding protein